VRTGTTISTIGHSVFLAWGLISFSARPFDVPPVDSIATDVISETEFSQLTAGVKTAPKVAKPQPVVDKVGAPSEPVKQPKAKPVDKPLPQIAEATPPPAPSKPEPPTKSDTKPAPSKAEPAAKTDTKPDISQPEADPIAEALNKEEAKRKEDAKRADDAKKREEAKKREDAKRREEAKKREEQKFDFDRIQTALLDKRAPQRAIATGTLVNPNPSLGSPLGNAPELSQNEIDALRAQLMGCWNPPVGVADAKDLIVIVRFALNRDGSVSGDPTVVNHGDSSLFQIAAESATRAVRRCQPFRLPVSKYDAWRDVEVKFDPNDLFRG
jgi:outer membrane biosynthesis protein TonB